MITFDIGGPCHVCGKYSNRVLNVSGKDWTPEHEACSHEDRYRAAMTAMARFMAWVWCEANAQSNYDFRGIWLPRNEAISNAMHCGLFCLEFAP